MQSRMTAVDQPVPALSVRSLRFRWPGASHDTVSVDAFTVTAGEQIYLHGPSGCGKSTLLSLAAGVLDADAGVVAVGGQSWRKVLGGARDAVRADQLGIMFQQFNLLPYLSALDNVCLGCRYSASRQAKACEGGSSVESSARTLLEAMNLPRALHDQPASRLSVGQQQRVAAARALIGSPSLLLADEPTSALDEVVQVQFMDLLQSACRAAGSALLLISHDSRLADRFDRAVFFADLAVAGSA